MAPPTFHPKAFYKHSGKNLLYLFLFSGLLWTPSLTKEVVFQTNLYAQQTGKPYTLTTEQEMRSFLGLNLLMGIKRSPSYRDYWSSAPDLHDPFISKIRTVNRFGWLLSHLCLNDNVLQPPRAHPDFDRLYKVRPLLSELSRSFATNYLPKEYLAIDESMIKFKGRSSLKQYMPKKPVKREYKVWMLCASTGYNLKFEIYSGRSESGVQKELGAQVVKKLCQDISGRHHRVFFDNYFTSYGLLKDLREQGIYACGTVNHNRKHLPKLQADKEMERGNADWSVSDESVCCMKWKDKRSVHLLSNFHDPTQGAEVDRKNNDGTVTKVPCAAALHDYNKNMNFVNKFGQMKGQYEIDRK
ncbi:piggyBac transposable element-derived protein 4 [Ixodes scapularis]